MMIAVNSVKISPLDQAGAWVDVGYATLVSLEAKLGSDGQGSASIGEVCVAATPEGITVFYEKSSRSYALKLNLLGDTPQWVLEDETITKRL